jgi:H+/Na+-translocating ferredoxin:NAD+ oxidoreductase subunit B
LNLGPLVERIDALLPQTQCTRCGYSGCLPYAEALATQQSAINRCPPGGSAGIAALAALLHRAPLPLDPSCGREQPATLAWIDPEACIGCARCLPACPVDAIIGAQQHLHTVLERECNGCELCLAACPVDCITLRPRPSSQAAPTADENRQRFLRHRAREQRRSRERAQLLAERKQAAQPRRAPPALPSR